MIKNLFFNRFFVGILVLSLLCFFGGMIYLNMAKRQTADDARSTDGLTEQENRAGRMPLEDVSQDGRLREDSTQDTSSPGKINLPDNTESSLEKTFGKDTADVKKSLTPLEEALLERGIDINQLPRGKNGELLRGPTGGISLVPNPVAPTQADIERFENRRRLRERLAEIEAKLLTFLSNGTMGPERFPEVLDLQEEKIRIQQELGVEFRGVDPLIAIEISRHAMNVITDKGIPVSSAPRFIELYKKMGALDMANLFQTAAENAARNGEDFFNFSPETE